MNQTLTHGAVTAALPTMPLGYPATIPAVAPRPAFLPPKSMF
jgi:hypothetical protein